MHDTKRASNVTNNMDSKLIHCIHLTLAGKCRLDLCLPRQRLIIYSVFHIVVAIQWKTEKSFQLKSFELYPS